MIVACNADGEGQLLRDMVQEELSPQLADAKHPQSLRHARGKKRRRDKPVPITGVQTDVVSPVDDGSAAPASLQDAPAGATLSSPTQLGSDRPRKKRRKHADRNPLSSDGVDSERQAAPQTEQQPASPDMGTHRKHRKTRKTEAARLDTSLDAIDGSTGQHLASTSVSEASDIKHGSRPPSSRNREGGSGGASTHHDEDNRLEGDETTAAAHSPASSAEITASEPLAGTSGAEACNAESGQSPNAGQLPEFRPGHSLDETAQGLQDPAEGQEDTAGALTLHDTWVCGDV